MNRIDSNSIDYEEVFSPVETGPDGGSGSGSPVAISRGTTRTCLVWLDLQDHQPVVASIATVPPGDHGSRSHSPVLTHLICLENEREHRNGKQPNSGGLTEVGWQENEAKRDKISCTNCRRRHPIDTAPVFEESSTASAVKNL